MVKFIDEDTGFTDIAIDPVNTNILYAASYQRRRMRVLLQRRRPRQRAVEDHGRRQDLDEADVGPPVRHLRANRARRLPLEPERRLRADRSRSDRAALTTGADDPGAATESTPAGAAAVPRAPATTTQSGAVAEAAGRGAPAAARAGRGARLRRRRGWWSRLRLQLVQQRRAGRRIRARHAAGRGRTTPAPPPLDPAPRRHLPIRQQGRRAGRRSATATRGRCTSASCASIRATTRRCTSPGCRWRSRSTAARTFATLDDAGGHSSPGHVDQHAIWIDPRNPKHLMIGNDGGFNVSWDQGSTWDFVNTMATATAYWVSADMRRPYYVYIGLQDNGSWGGPSATRSRERHPQLRLVRHRRRRRIPDRRRSHRLQHRLHGVAGRQHEPLRPAERPRQSIRPARRSAGRAAVARGGARRRRRRRRAAAAANVLERRPRRAATASTGTRRSSSRRTTRASSGSAATGCSSRQPRRHVDRPAPISPSRSIATRSR